MKPVLAGLIGQAWLMAIHPFYEGLHLDGPFFCLISTVVIMSLVIMYGNYKSILKSIFNKPVQFEQMIVKHYENEQREKLMLAGK